MKLSHLTACVAVLLMLVACGGATQEQQTETAMPAATESEPAPAPGTAQPESDEPAPTPPPQTRPAAAPPDGQDKPAQGSAAPARKPAAPAAAAKPAPMATVPAGTVLWLAMDEGVSSKTAQVGDGFTATVVQPVVVDDQEVIPAGSSIEGRVTEAVAAKRGAGKARLALSIDLLRLPDGYNTNIVATFQEVTESKKKRNAAVIGGSAAGGALLGRILGKDTKGAVIGSIIGGGVGTAVVMGKEGEQAKIPADTPFEIRLEESVRVPAKPSRS